MMIPLRSLCLALAVCPFAASLRTAPAVKDGLRRPDGLADSQKQDVNRTSKHGAAAARPERSEKSRFVTKEQWMAAIAPELQGPEQTSNQTRKGQEEEFKAQANASAVTDLRHLNDTKVFATVRHDDAPVMILGEPWSRSRNPYFRPRHPDFDGLVPSGDFKTDILNGHNVVRNRGGVSPQLTWSVDLQKFATIRAQSLSYGKCRIDHSSKSGRMGIGGFYYVGENLYMVKGFEPNGLDISDAWYAEVYDYKYGSVGAECTKKCAGRRAPPCMVGHFTQMLWARTQQVGCGVSPCASLDNAYVAVCLYGEGGNIVGEVPFDSTASTMLSVSALGTLCDWN